MNWARSIRLIAARDFRERATSRAFQLSTGITMLMVLAFVLIPTFFDDAGAPTWRIGFVGEVPTALESQLLAAAPEDTTLEVESFADTAAAEAALSDDDIDIALDGGEVLVEDGTDPQLTTLLSATVSAGAIAQRAADLGVSQDELAALLAAPVTVRNIEPADKAEEDNRNAALLGTIVLFVSIVTYGQWILIGVIEEKTNRVVEVVLGTVRPHVLMAGKVLGIGALGLGQLLLIMGVVIAGIAYSDVEFPTAAATIFATLVVWFVLGFVFYATAYAAAGSMVSRQEEAQNAAFPLTMVLMAAYFVAAFSFTGDNPLLRIASLLPPFAPMTMPLRMSTGDAAGWEVALSLTLMVITTYLLVLLAGRIYSGGLLKTGKKVKLREAWTAADGR